MAAAAVFLSLDGTGYHAESCLVDAVQASDVMAIHHLAPRLLWPREPLRVAFARLPSTAMTGRTQWLQASYCCRP